MQNAKISIFVEVANLIAKGTTIVFAKNKTTGTTKYNVTGIVTTENPT